MKKLAALLALALASLAFVACGGSDSTTTAATSSGSETSGGAAAEGGEKTGGKEGGGGGSTVDFETDPEGSLAYTTTEASVKTGKVTIDFNNPQGLTHDVAIEDASGETVGKTDLIAGEETSATVDLKPGKYTCLLYTSDAA